jgi:hypothetical protein
MKLWWWPRTRGWQVKGGPPQPLSPSSGWTPGTRGLPAHRYMNHSLCQHPRAGLQGQGASLLTGTGRLVMNHSLCQHPWVGLQGQGVSLLTGTELYSYESQSLSTSLGWTPGTRGLPAHRYMNHSLCHYPRAERQGQGVSLLTGT